MSVDVQQQQQQPVASGADEAGAENGPPHPLKNKWTLWYLNDDRKSDWESRLKKVHTVTTVEDFWALYNNIRPPSSLANTTDYSVFKESIIPKWEVPENSQGGRWVIQFDKNRGTDIMDAVWLELLIAMLGEQYGPHMDAVCGMVFNARSKGSKICIWTTQKGDDATNKAIGDVIKQKLKDAEVVGEGGERRILFDVIKYEGHDDCQAKSGSQARVLHVINNSD